MRVTDQRVTQERIDTSTVVVNVQRDQFPPVFQNMPYGVSITDSQALNTTIYTVSAVDADLRVSDRMDIESVAGESKSECSLHGDPGNNSISFRYLFCIVLILSIFMSNYLQNENLIFYPSKSWKFFKKMEKGLKCKKAICYFQGRIVYESIGVYPAQTFFAVNNLDGRITVIDNLMNDGFYRSTYTVSKVLSCQYKKKKNV